MQGLLSIVEAAGLLGLSKWTIRDMVGDGRINVVRLGRRVLIERDELLRLIEAGKCVGKKK
jgi:excisionase family DNA binding protein